MTNTSKVSVPFRGSRSEIGANTRLSIATTAFPSPFGVHVLKSAASYGNNGGCKTFPSPFGVHVLKCFCVAILRRSRGCFRPLSGFTF